MSEVKYTHDIEIHNTKDAETFLPILFKYVNPKSVLDIGCGIGSWLSVFSNMGIRDFVGVDGSNVDKTLLSIPAKHFIEHNLSKPLDLHRRFELALCLEVAEHLPIELADNIIEILTLHSDVILFSAALPMQFGQNHLNEQPFEFWVEKFNKRGYVLKDVFRDLIWNDSEIKWWYRQNMFLVIKQDVTQQERMNDYYHPERYAEIFKDYLSWNRQLNDIQRGKIPVTFAFRTLIKAIMVKLKLR